MPYSLAMPFRHIFKGDTLYRNYYRTFPYDKQYENFKEKGFIYL